MAQSWFWPAQKLALTKRHVFPPSSPSKPPFLPLTPCGLVSMWKTLSLLQLAKIRKTNLCPPACLSRSFIYHPRSGCLSVCYVVGCVSHALWMLSIVLSRETCRQKQSLKPVLRWRIYSLMLSQKLSVCIYNLFSF